MITAIANKLRISEGMAENLVFSAAALLLLILFKILTTKVICRNIEDDKRRYHVRRTVTHVYSVFLIVVVGGIWFQGMASLGTFLGLASAGLAVALHDTIANMAGFFFIEARKPFRVGDRIEIGGVQGDVIDIRLFQFSIVEVGNWVDADQSTGRIIHVPNSMTLKEPLSNSHIGFEYIWNEIPVRVSFESDWRKAKEMLLMIAKENAEYLSPNAQSQIRKAAKKYLIVAGKLTPTVYTTVKENGVMLTIRYLVDPRQRRGTEMKMWEEILDAFAKMPNVALAYPTTRFYSSAENNPASPSSLQE
ncbi:mechanosensitive ion channel [Pontiellaceae bacterium B12219]|nr:mechanosensitive ion channel [Pontiellaceae bacterium B12219]